MNIKPILLTIFVGIAAMTAAAQAGPMLDAQIKQKTFEKAWRIINDKFYDANFNGVDWKAVHDRYQPMMAGASSDSEFYYLLNQMLKELKVSHIGILTPSDLAKLKTEGTTTGLSLRMIENQLVVRRVLPGSSAEKFGIKPGFIIQKVVGAEVTDIDGALEKLSGAPGSTVEITYQDAADNLKTAILVREPLGDANKGDIGRGIKSYALFESKRLENNIGYLTFTSFMEFLTPRIISAIRSMRDATGLIIDLRGNGGGDDSVALKMANELFDRETQLMISKTRKVDELCYKAKPVKDPYLGPVVILVDGLSGSASEQFAAGMQETGRAYIIGKTTIGEDMDADLAKLPCGAYLLYPAMLPRTPKGVVIEGRGVVPDKDIGLTRAGLLAGHDAQLEAAIEYIKSKSQK